MNEQMKVFAVAGSLREGSYNRAALEAARELVPEGMEIDVFEELEEIPPFNQDEEANPPRAVSDLKRRIREANAVLFVTPEYNFSVPGVLKNAIDWASRPYGDNSWDDKPVAVMGVSPGKLGTVRAQNHLRQTFLFLNMHQLNSPEVMISEAAKRFDNEGHLTDEKTREFVQKMLHELGLWTQRLKETPSPGDDEGG
jgi:chromate reductase, NAD(P)H dehydrogenase (quinone)